MAQIADSYTQSLRGKQQPFPGCYLWHPLRRPSSSRKNTDSLRECAGSRLALPPHSDSQRSELSMTMHLSGPFPKTPGYTVVLIIRWHYNTILLHPVPTLSHTLVCTCPLVFVPFQALQGLKEALGIKPLDHFNMGPACSLGAMEGVLCPHVSCNRGQCVIRSWTTS